MHIRAFRPSDLETLAAMDQSCFPPGIAYSRQQLAGFIAAPGARTWVATEGATSVGFLVGERIGRETVHINTIDVLEAWRRRGVGKILMDAAEAWARSKGAKAISLETSRDNRVAQRFYQSRGFTKVGEIEGYYQDGKTAWVMVKRLKQ